MCYYLITAKGILKKGGNQFMFDPLGIRKAKKIKETNYYLMKQLMKYRDLCNDLANQLRVMDNLLHEKEQEIAFLRMTLCEMDNITFPNTEGFLEGV